MKRATFLVVAAAAAGCTQEARDVSPDPPWTAPTSAGDPRIAAIQENVYQVSQGGRYFGWYGCGGCHGSDAPASRDLASGRWRHGGAFDQVYRSITIGHGALRYGERVPTQQLWQITAYVRDLPQEKREKIVRQDHDQQGEPTGPTWSGPVR
jgi:cytochrome c oxidase cbb3-type subunit III